MKLCQKCMTEIGRSTTVGNSDTIFENAKPSESYRCGQLAYDKLVPESDCEFWAHQALRKEQLARRVWPI